MTPGRLSLIQTSFSARVDRRWIPTLPFDSLLDLFIMNHDKMMKRDEVAAIPVSNLLCHLEHFPAGWVKHFILPHCSFGWCMLALGHGDRVDERLSETAVTGNFDL